MSAYAAEDVPLVSVVGREANQDRGHIALGPPNGQPIGVFVDLGDGLLRFWSYESARIDSAGARELAADLLAWADRRDATTPPAPVCATPDAADRTEGEQ